MSRYIFDIETDGLLDQVTKVHSLVLRDIDTGEVYSFADHRPYDRIQGGLMLLENAKLLVGHNVIKFDVPVLEKLYNLKLDPSKIEDTLVLARLFYPDTKTWDTRLKNEGNLPGRLWGSQGLEAWGYRLGMNKGDYAKECKEAGIDPWAQWSVAMQEYCEQDTQTNLALYQLIQQRIQKIEEPKPVGEEPESTSRSIALEHATAWLCAKMERNGFPFKEAEAGKLYGHLVQRRQDLEAELQAIFPPWWESVKEISVTKTRNEKMPEEFGTVTERRFSEKTGKELKPYIGPPKVNFEEGATYTKVSRVTFNPGSRHHIANRLKAYHGWEPTEWTQSGEPKVDEAVLSKLPWPEAKKLTEYLLVQKRVGQIGEGRQAWLKHVRDGRIHGSINTNGAVTGRATHSHPNIGQVPSTRAAYGKECRSLFHAPSPWALLGSDQDALELRCLAGYMSLWDNGAYIDVVLKGDKAAGTDLHSVNCRALGMDPKKEYPVEGKNIPGRDIAKTWFYAFIYGAGNVKLGLILGAKSTGKATSIGKQSRENFLRNLPALGALTKAVQETSKHRGYLLGLDGRRLVCRSEHSALNTLLQSAGALLCKKWICLIDEKLQVQDLDHGWDGQYAFCAWVHDEVQIAVLPEFADEVGRICGEAAVEAGQFFNFSCPTAADFAIGQTWADTH